MKAGIAAAVFAAEAIRRAGVELQGTVEMSGTVDEESGGFAGVAWLAEHGRLSAGAHRLRHHPRAAQRRSHLHRPSRRLLVRGDDATAASRTAACRFSASARSSTWALVLEPDPPRAAAALASARPRCRSIPPAARATRRLNVNGIDGGQAVRRHPDAVRRRPLPRRLRSPLPARGRLRRDAGRRSSSCSSAIGRARAGLPLRAPRSDGRPSRQHAGGLPRRDRGTRAGAPSRARPQRRRSWPAPGPTITSTWRASPGVPHCVAYGPGILDLAHQPDEYCDVGRPGQLDEGSGPDPPGPEPPLLIPGRAPPRRCSP